MRQRQGTLLLAVLVMSATLGGCGDSGTATSPTVTRTVTVPPSTVTVASTTNAERDRQRCENLPIPASVRAALLDGKLDAGSVFFGKCDVYYAIGTYTGPIGSENYSFRRDTGKRRWENLSGVSDLSHLCAVPLELVLLWNLRDDPLNCRRG